ncbi:hypothetical protein QEN19_003890 [Hanseniaspora menglaensis]
MIAVLISFLIFSCLKSTFLIGLPLQDKNKNFFITKKNNIISNNPTGAVYEALFPSSGSLDLTGSVSFFSQNGTAQIFVNLKGLPENYGGFLYHIHENSSPHKYKNDFAYDLIGQQAGYSKTSKFLIFKNHYLNDQSYYSVGDLSGKHGKILAPKTTKTYYDNYLSLDPANPLFIGNKSLIIHFENTTILASAKICLSKTKTLKNLLQNQIQSLKYDEQLKNSNFFETKLKKVYKRDQTNDFKNTLDWGILIGSKFNGSKQPNILNSYTPSSNKLNITTDKIFFKNDNFSNLKNNSVIKNITLVNLPFASNKTNIFSNNAVYGALKNFQLYGFLRLLLLFLLMAFL